MKFQEKILQLRYKLKLSQEDFAERINVTRKAIQNWESGKALPDGKNLLEISSKFDVSIDELLLDTNKRVTEEHFDKIVPTKNKHLWESYEKELMDELKTSILEGKDIKKYENLIKEVSLMESSSYKERMADVIFDMVNESKTLEGYKYFEPNNYNEIKRISTTVPKVNIDKENIKNKIKGAWLGRICGCLLGKPIECQMHDNILYLLKQSNNYPMCRYINLSDITNDIKEKTKIWIEGNAFADVIDTAPTDDDTNYTVLAEKILEDYGRDFKPENVLDAWLKYQPKDAYCTAERVAWRNYFNGYMPPYTAMYKNPYRDWIGAQIRVDFYGYINPGNVEEAVRMAFNDASISHTKNGIYGALYISAMIAHAAVCDNMEEVIHVGLSQVPKTSRFYEQVSKIVEMYKTNKTEEECLNYIKELYDEHDSYGWCGAIPNSMIETMALLYHQDDYGKAICSAVQAGYDTDCNGATVGSIFGMMHGADCIDEKWTKPINGKLKTNIFGYECVSIDELVEKTLKYIEQ